MEKSTEKPKTTSESQSSKSDFAKQDVVTSGKETSVEKSNDASSPNWIADLTSRSGDFEKRVETLIRSRPILFLAGAVAVGYLANRLLTGTDARSAKEYAK